MVQIWVSHEDEDSIKSGKLRNLSASRATQGKAWANFELVLFYFLSFLFISFIFWLKGLFCYSRPNALAASTIKAVRLSFQEGKLFPNWMFWRQQTTTPYCCYPLLNWMVSYVSRRLSTWFPFQAALARQQLNRQKNAVVAAAITSDAIVTVKQRNFCVFSFDPLFFVKNPFFCTQNFQSITCWLIIHPVT